MREDTIDWFNLFFLSLSLSNKYFNLFIFVPLYFSIFYFLSNSNYLLIKNYKSIN